jgi:tetratricopeptide (TPR) repeat protein
MHDEKKLPEYIQAMEAFLSGDHAKAEEAITAVVQRIPDDPRMLHLLGNIKYTLGRLGEASAAYEKVISLDPGSCEAYFKLGVCYVRMGKLDDSLKAFKKNAAGQCGGHVMSYYWMGLINSFLGNDDAAREAFTLLHEESNESKLANFFLAQLLMRRNENAEALRLLQELLDVSPDFAEVHFLMGQVYSHMHRNVEAIQCFRKTLELNPEDKRARLEYERLVDVPPL